MTVQGQSVMVSVVAAVTVYVFPSWTTVVGPAQGIVTRSVIYVVIVVFGDDGLPVPVGWMEKVVCGMEVLDRETEEFVECEEMGAVPLAGMAATALARARAEKAKDFIVMRTEV